MVFIAKTKDFNMYAGASDDIRMEAKYLRHHMTEAENKLWEYLRNRNFIGLKFRRQHALGSYIADFYCVSLKLVIEVDGGIHNLPDVIQKEKDRGMRSTGTKLIIIL